ncbi:MAG TPA: hypothetical protein VFF36_17575, partial [Planctomycetota bacterium]|nr:hypothetical protein [Planctomycetota bacterium]
MFSALLAYQLIDVALALALVAFVAQLAAMAPLRRLAARYPALLGTELRRILLLEVPLLLVLLVGPLGLGRGVVAPALAGGFVYLERFGPQASSISFLWVGVAFWCLAALVPLRLAWRTLRSRAGRF